MVLNKVHWLCVALTVFIFTGILSAENWPGWRGPRGDGSSLDPHVPMQWSGTENVAWKIPIPGIGHASPIIWGDRLFVVTCLVEQEQRLLLCLDRHTGNVLWQRIVLTSPLERKHKLNSYATSTPATDGKLVYVSFLDREHMFVAAYDFQGKQRWAVRPGRFSSVHGYCASPILYRDNVIVNGDHDGDAYIVALDKDTGNTRWKTDRENKTRSYCPPIIRDIDGRTQMLLSGSLCVASYDPTNGQRHWIIDGPTEQYVASLVYDGELVYLTCGFPQQHLMGIRPSGHGNVTDTHVVWHHRTKDAAYVPSPCVVNGYFIVPDDFGMVSCYEAKSGELQWREKLARHYSASTLQANGLVYLTADQGRERQEAGVTTIIKPGPQLDIVAQNILGEAVYASPAVYQGQLYLRSDKHLYCIGTSQSRQSWPFFALCMDTHDAQKRTLPQQAAMLKELGYEGCAHLWLDSLEERVTTLTQQGLRLFQVYMKVDLSKEQPFDEKQIQRVLPFLQKHQTQLALLIKGGNPSDTKLDDRAVSAIQRLADLTLPFDVPIVLYPHTKDWLETCADGVRVAEIVDRTGNVGVMFNLCHWMKADVNRNLRAVLNQAKPWLMAVSLSGSDLPEQIRTGQGKWIQPLNQGSYDTQELLLLLKEIGYSGPIGLQCYGIGGDARIHLAQSISAWRKLCEE